MTTVVACSLGVGWMSSSLVLKQRKGKEKKRLFLDWLCKGVKVTCSCKVQMS